MDYAMSRDEISAEIRRRQRRLIPVNIVVAIIALVAAWSIMFMPFISVDVATIQSAMSGNSGSSSTEGDSGAGTFNDVLSDVIEDADMQVSFTTMDFIMSSFDSQAENQVVGVVSEVIRSNQDELITQVMVPVLLETYSSNTGTDIKLSDETLLLEKFKALETCTDDQVDGVIDDFTDELQLQLGEEVINAEMADSIRDVIRQYYDLAVENNDGKFTLEAGICVCISDNSFSETGTIYTDYDQLMGEFIGGENAEIEQYMAIISPMILGFTIAMTFFALVWFILFIFAFVHIFLSNKFVAMWYVKLFGLYPFIIFTLVPMVAGKLFVESAAIFAAISSATWICGVCYLLLWIVSIFWAFPIKRKIRAYGRQLY